MNNNTPIFLQWVKGILSASMIPALIFLVVGVVNLAYGSVDATPGKHALLIDIQRYSHQKDRNSGTGTTTLRRTLVNEGFDVRFIRDGTRREVNQSLNELVYRVKGSDVVIVVINAGVATTDRSDDVYILFQDTRTEDIEVDGLSLRALDVVLDRLKTPNQLLALTLDTLGTAVKQSANATNGTSMQPTRTELQRLIAEQLQSLGEERVVLSEIDSRDDKTSNTTSLAMLLAKGIRGRADANNDSVVETSELEIFVERHSSQTPVIQGYQVQADLQSSKLIRITPVEGEESMPSRSMKLASRSLKKVVLTDAAASRHKTVLADWVVDGLLSRADNLRLYTFMSTLRGKTKEQVPAECYRYYKSLEPTLQDAYLLQKDSKRNQLDNLVVAEKIKRQLLALPGSCLKK
ncbi:MAG: caspase family protein [bacterium]